LERLHVLPDVAPTEENWADKLFQEMVEMKTEKEIRERISWMKRQLKVSAKSSWNQSHLPESIRVLKWVLE
jgi:hypothetical protein